MSTSAFIVVEVTGRQPCSTRNPVAVLEAVATEAALCERSSSEEFTPNPLLMQRRTLVTGTNN